MSLLVTTSISRLAQDVRRSVRKRPLAPWAILLALGTLTGTETGVCPFIWPCVVSLGLTVVLVGSLRRHLRERWWGDSILVIIFALFIFSVGAMRGDDGKADFFTGGGKCHIEGEITRITYRDSSRVSAVVRADSINRRYAGELKGLVNFKDKDVNMTSLAKSLKCGMKVRLWGRFTTPRTDIFGDFDYQEYLKSQGLMYLATADSVTIDGKMKDLASVSGMAHDLFTSSLEKSGVSRESRVFLQALVLADRSELPREVRQAFTDCGTGHVLAVSGLHVGILSMAVMSLIGLLFGSRATGVITLIVIWGYALLVGLAPSIVRSSVMFSFLTLEKVIGRRMPSFHSLWAALFVIVLADPQSVTSAGLWLSFAAVGGILAATPSLRPYIERKRGPVKWLYGGLATSVVAQLATLPIMLYCFNSFPTYFWINNLVVLEPVKWIFVGSVICPFISWLPLLGGGLGWLIDNCLQLVIGYCEWAATLPMATIGCTAFGMGEAVSLSIVIAVAFYAIRKWDRRWRGTLYIAVICFLCVLIIGEARQDGGIVMFSSNGEAGIVVSEDRHKSLSYITDTTIYSAVKAVRHIEKERRWTEKGIRGIGNGIILNSHDLRIAIVNTDDIETLPFCDIYLINSNIDPTKAINPEASYLIGPKCEMAAAWRQSPTLNVTILKRQEEYTIK